MYYSGHSLVGRGSYISLEMQSVYSTAPSYWAKKRFYVPGIKTLQGTHKIICTVSDKCFASGLQIQLRSRSNVYTNPLAQLLECSPIAWQTGFNLRSRHTKDKKKWYLTPPCLALSIIRVKLGNLGKEVVPPPTPQSSSCWKRSQL